MNIYYRKLNTVQFVVSRMRQFFQKRMLMIRQIGIGMMQMIFEMLPVMSTLLLSTAVTGYVAIAIMKSVLTGTAKAMVLHMTEMMTLRLNANSSDRTSVV